MSQGSHSDTRDTGASLEEIIEKGQRTLVDADAIKELGDKTKEEHVKESVGRFQQYPAKTAEFLLNGNDVTLRFKGADGGIKYVELPASALSGFDDKVKGLQARHQQRDLDPGRRGEEVPLEDSTNMEVQKVWIDALREKGFKIEPDSVVGIDFDNIGKASREAPKE